MAHLSWILGSLSQAFLSCTWIFLDWYISTWDDPTLPQFQPSIFLRSLPFFQLDWSDLTANASSFSSFFPFPEPCLQLFTLIFWILGLLQQCGHQGVHIHWSWCLLHHSYYLHWSEIGENIWEEQNWRWTSNLHYWSLLLLADSSFFNCDPSKNPSHFLSWTPWC